MRELKIILARRDSNLAELAEQLGVHRSWLDRRVDGKVDPTLGDIERICGALGVSYTELLGDVSDPSEAP